MFIEILSPREIFPLPQKILKLNRGVGLPSFLTLRELTTNASQPFVLSSKFETFLPISFTQIMAANGDLADEPHKTFDTILTLDFGFVTLTRFPRAKPCHS
jgi:hypothetical protein